MQAARNAAASAKEMAANTAASAKAGLDKAKATVQEKVEKMRADDPIQKDMATLKKEERIHEAESNKQEARDHNAAAHHVAADHGNQNSTTGPGHVAGTEHGNKHIATTGGTGPNTGGQGGFTTPDYLTGSGVPGTGGHNPGRNTTVEYPLTGPNTQTGLNPAREPGNADAVYPADIGLGGGTWPDPARNAHGGGPTSGFSTGGLIN